MKELVIVLLLVPAPFYSKGKEDFPYHHLIVSYKNS